MKHNIFKHTAIMAVAGILLLVSESQAATHYVNSPGVISVCGPDFVDNMDETWVINLGVNKYLKIECFVDVDSGEYLECLTSTGVAMRDMRGCGEYSFYTTQCNGQAIIRFISDESISYSDGYWGFEIYISVDSRNYITSDQIFTGKTYFSSPIVLGSLTGEVNPQYTLNVGGSSYFRGNVRFSDYVGIGCAPATGQRLSIEGPVSVKNGLVSLSGLTGQFINVTSGRNTSHTWSIGTVYNTNKFAIGQGKSDNTQFTNPYLSINTDGKVGIGTANPQYLLDVKGAFRAAEIIADAIEVFPDFVFDKDYRLPALSEVSRFIQENGHLPDIPAESEVKENGMNIADMQVKLLQKIEELTLYIIQQDRKIESLEKKLSGMEKR